MQELKEKECPDGPSRPHGVVQPPRVYVGGPSVSVVEKKECPEMERASGRYFHVGGYSQLPAQSPDQPMGRLVRRWSF